MPVKVTNLDEIQKSLKRLRAYTINLKPTLKAVGEMVRTSIDESFESEKSPFGKRWKPISATTAFNYAGGKRKSYYKNGKSQKKGFLQKYGIHGDKKLLYESGNLRTSWGVKADNKSVVVESYAKGGKQNFPYGLTHQFGSKGIPPRPFLPIDSSGNLEPNLKRDILEMIENDINKKATDMAVKTFIKSIKNLT
ncbi:phage virion morphogenesis protein [Campylobacter corcagiensis]|uniref:Phage virion morphogenesis protein n=1 Tax=Campylobacter corcagiensis TaxID=1448857 RepID=A0A7M1LIC8_9BACT|nr:phage virion morphogenesis protein [Campylobacter corcagiensis]QKF64572.1 putative phage virion morphogenesis protein [Campylobacter corcagiensis]QOQ87255.1 phage virion morphogenesis protein [Campylobacter corcagiensis]